MEIKLTRQSRTAKAGDALFYGELWQQRGTTWHMVAASDRFDVTTDDYSPLTTDEMDGYAKTFDSMEVL